METTEVTTPNVSQKTTSPVEQKPIESNKQEQSFIRIFYPRSEWSDTLELLGCIFLTIIIYVVSCELMRFCMLYVDKIPTDASLYRYQCFIIILIGMIGFLTVCIVTIGSALVSKRAIEYIFRACVKYFYVDGRNSYKWYQKKKSIEFIINSIILLICIVFLMEFGNIIFADNNQQTLAEDRFVIYQLSGFIGAAICSFVKYSPDGIEYI